MYREGAQQMLERLEKRSINRLYIDKRGGEL